MPPIKTVGLPLYRKGGEICGGTSILVNSTATPAFTDSSLILATARAPLPQPGAANTLISNSSRWVLRFEFDFSIAWHPNNPSRAVTRAVSFMPVILTLAPPGSAFGQADLSRLVRQNKP
jgi:hypothetical protein